MNKNIRLFIKYKDNDYSKYFNTLRLYTMQIMNNIEDILSLKRMVSMLVSISYLGYNIADRNIKKKEEVVSEFNFLFDYFQKNIEIYIGEDATKRLEKEYPIQNKESLYINIIINNNKVVNETFTII